MCVSVCARSYSECVCVYNLMLLPFLSHCQLLSPNAFSGVNVYSARSPSLHAAAQAGLFHPGKLKEANVKCLPGPDPLEPGFLCCRASLCSLLSAYLALSGLSPADAISFTPPHYCVGIPVLGSMLTPFLASLPASHRPPLPSSAMSTLDAGASGSALACVSLSGLVWHMLMNLWVCPWSSF